MTPTLQHILLVDILPIVLIVAAFLIYRRMELRLLNARMKMLSDDATFWRQKYDVMTQEFFRFRDEFEANRKLAYKPLPYDPNMIYKPAPDNSVHPGGVLDLPKKNPSNAQVLPPAGVARLIADLESKDFENILNRGDEQ